MTARGEKLLREELDRLLKLRPKITEAIAEARELGDLKENAEYHAAREEQGSVKRKFVISNTSYQWRRLLMSLRWKTVAKSFLVPR